MKTAEDYRNMILTIVGDAAGRRYSESMLNLGLLEALDEYRDYCPRVVPQQLQVLSVTNGHVISFPDYGPDETDIAYIKDPGGEYYENFTVFYAADRIEVTLRMQDVIPKAGQALDVGISVPHCIRGLDGKTITTVPDRHMRTVCKGAAAAAMKIRARSVTEVFGKRPEDREAITAQADAMHAEFMKELEGLAKHESLLRDPWGRM